MLTLRFTLDQIRLRGLELQTGSGWRRQTTVVELVGEGCTGAGEDVTYSGKEQSAFQLVGAPPIPAGEYTLARFSAVLDALSPQQWFAQSPEQEASYHYRRWAFESAALDLALKQNHLHLEDCLHLEARPVHFAYSTGLGTPPSVQQLRKAREQVPALAFKIDYDSAWTEELVQELADLGGVGVVDFKGHYHGSFSGPPPNPSDYAMVARLLPKAWLEDPAWTPECAQALAPYRNRIIWGAPLHLMRDLEALPFLPQCINIKPSRFATVERLLRILQWAQNNGVQMYGGGQFELGPGRRQVQHLASLAYPDATNDVAPVDFHQDLWPATLASGPLPAFAGVAGFGG